MRRALTALTLIFALLLTGCTGESEPPAETPQVSTSPIATPEPTRFTLPYHPDASLHPITGSDRVNFVLNSLVYQGLFELDNNFTPHGVLCASSAVSEDGLTWTFTLNSNTFSDGTALTADHVVASLNLARTSVFYASRLADVLQIHTGEDGTVILTLSRPNSALPALLDIPIVCENGDGGLALGTGAYAFVEDGGPLRLVRQPSAPGTAPQEIDLQATAGADELIYAFDSGDVSLVVSDLTNANALGYSSGYETFSFPTTTMLYVGFRTDEGTCQDPLIRQAISRSFDRDTVTASLLAGHAEATCLPVSPRSTRYSAGQDQAGAYSPAAAKELLDQAGCKTSDDGLLYKSRTLQSLVFLVNTDNTFKVAIAEYLAGQLSSLGFSVDLQKLSWDDYVVALAAGKFDLYLGEVALSADFDLTALLSAEGSLNYGRYDNPDTVVLLEQLRAAGPDQLTAAADILWEQLRLEAPFSPLCFKRSSVLLKWGTVSGLTPTRQNPFYKLDQLRFD